jgi:hypothetical protein
LPVYLHCARCPIGGIEKRRSVLVREAAGRRLINELSVEALFLFDAWISSAPLYKRVGEENPSHSLPLLESVTRVVKFVRLFANT